MFGQPEALIAEPIGGLGQGQGLIQAASGVAAFDDGREVEN